MKPSKPLVTAFGFIVVASAFAAQPSRRPASQTRSSQGQAATGWIAHKDPLGFSVDVPRGWTVTADRSSGRVEIQGVEGEQVVVWPVFIPSSLTTGTASAALRKLATKFWPDARWQAPQSAGAAAVRMRGRAGDRAATSILTWIASPKGSAGYVYALAAPETRYRQTEETFAKLLQSFRIVGAATGEKKEAALSFVRWQDPRERAFSLEVPSSWKVGGGLFRFASVDVRSAIEAVSPDGKIRITGGDAEIPPFAVPNPTLEMTGFREGSWYSPGYGVNLMVRRHVPGTAFAREYVMAKVARGCADTNFTDARDRADAVRAMNAVYSQYGALGVSMQLTAGEVAFTCRRDNQPMQGYYFAATQLTQAYGMGQWRVEILYGYLAASGKTTQAQSALEHMLKTIQLNPQWVAMQQNITANTSQIVSQTHEAISNIISSSYWNRQGVMDELSRRRSNATLGVEDVIDPTTGREFKVESGSNYYWIDHREMIVGTDTYTRPTIDFREMIRLP
jgi:hypothetical protein